MSVYAIGDIHGEYDKLGALWRKISPSKDDKIVFLGDFCDRGKNSRRVISMIIKWKEDGYNITCLRGNHEDMFMAYLKLIPCPDIINSEELEGIFMYNGGERTILQYNMKRPPSTHLNFLKETKIYHIIGDYVFVHAGFKPGVKLEDQKYSDMLWIREDFIESKFNFFDKKVIFGHTPFKQPYIDNYKIGIDTGAVFTKRGYGILTCVKLPEEEFIQV